jgi:mannose-1-phosphate guanylyltransferase
MKLTRRILGDSRPKQFCALFGGQSLLVQTRERVSPMFPPERTMLVLARDHQRSFATRFTACANRTWWRSRRTGERAPPWRYRCCLCRAAAGCGGAFFPCDHNYANDEAFTYDDRLRHGFARRHSELIVVIGAKADYPETEYGWIAPGAPMGDGQAGLHSVCADSGRSCR